MPTDGIGVIVLVISDHAAPLYNYVSYNVYERLLGLSETPWSARGLDIRLKGKKAGTEARAKAGAERDPSSNRSRNGARRLSQAAPGGAHRRRGALALESSHEESGPPGRHDSGRGMRCAPPRLESVAAWDLASVASLTLRSPQGRMRLWLPDRARLLR